MIATGSEARMLPGLQPDAKRILTNIEILDLHAVSRSRWRSSARARWAWSSRRASTASAPKSRVFEMLPRIVPVEDEEVSKELERLFKKTGIRVETGAKVENVQRTDNGVRFSAALSQRQSARTWKRKRCWSPWAASRTPRTLGSKARRSNSIAALSRSTEYQRTGEPGVYAIGDVVAGTPQLAHVATAEGMVAMAHIAGKPATPINRNRIPGAPIPSRASAASG